VAADLITLPEFSLVLLVGVSGAGKTSFARKHFSPTSILTSDKFRAMIADDENCMEASRDAFDLLYTVARARLKRRLFTVVDATNIQDYGRKILLDIAAEFGAPPVAVVLSIPEDTCIERTLKRKDRPIPMAVLMEQFTEFRETLGDLQKEGFDAIHILDGPDEIDNVIISIQSDTPVLPEKSPPLPLVAHSGS